MRALVLAIATLGGALALGACGPVPVERAERICRDRVTPPAPVSGDAGIGVSSSGVQSRARVRFNIGTGMSGDPSAAYDRCVFDQSGRMPTRPYYARTDWKG